MVAELECVCVYECVYPSRVESGACHIDGNSKESRKLVKKKKLRLHKVMT